MNEYQRIECILKYLNLTARAFSKKLDLKSPQIFYDIKSNKCGISKDLASKIHNKFTSINLSWILTGTGEMLEKDDSIKICNNQNNIKSNNINSDDVLKKMTEVFEYQLKIKDEQIIKSQDQITKSQEQIDRLLKIIENK